MIKRKKVSAASYKNLLAEWVRFYRKLFGIKVDFSDLVVPQKQEGFDWLLIMFQGLSANKLFAKCQERFGAWRYIKDLDTIRSEREAKHNYAIWLRDRVEADVKNVSADVCKRQGINYITLQEHMLLALWYHWKTGKPLDINNVNVCFGSHTLSGGVPEVRWMAGILSIDNGPPPYVEWRARSVVS